jgi:hypothetical protein
MSCFNTAGRFTRKEEQEDVKVRRETTTRTRGKETQKRRSSFGNQ